MSGHQLRRRREALRGRLRRRTTLFVECLEVRSLLDAAPLVPVDPSQAADTSSTDPSQASDPTQNSVVDTTDPSQTTDPSATAVLDPTDPVPIDPSVSADPSQTPDPPAGPVAGPTDPSQADPLQADPSQTPDPAQPPVVDPTGPAQGPDASTTPAADTPPAPAAAQGFADVVQPGDIPYNPNGSDTPFATAAPTGTTPTQIRHAYGFDQLSFAGGTVVADGSGTTIAIVDAFDDPTIASDLHQFDLFYGLPDPVFTKVNQTGGTSYPQPNSGWATEISLDVEWAHVIAPKAHILLVEATTNFNSDLQAAVQFAASQPGVVVVSMSYGGSEFSSELATNSIYTTPSGHPGVTFVASSGDSGSPPGQPAILPNVLAVGGTTLPLDSAGDYPGTGTSGEVGWSGSGGGISAYVPQPTYQTGVVTQSSTRRTNPDVAYDANPSTGFPIYDSYSFPLPNPWARFGGTSDAAPQWSAMIALIDQGRALAGLGSLDGPSQTLPRLYGLPTSDFHDILSGTSTGSPNYSAAAGYDLVTGIGTPLANVIVPALSGDPGSFGASATTPAQGSVVFAAPTSFAITFTVPIDPASLSASALLVNGIAASGVSLSANDLTATFTYNTSPVASYGLQTMTMAANSVYQLGSPTTQNEALGFTFRHDDVLLQVTSTTPAPSATILTVPTLTYDVTFNKPVDPSSVTVNSLIVSGVTGATVTSATVLPGNTSVQFTINVPTAGTLSVGIPAGAVLDLYDNPGAAYSASDALTPLTQIAPVGSQIYSGSVTGQIATGGASNAYTLVVASGQTVTLLVTPSPGLQPTVQLNDPSNNPVLSATAASAGANALLETVATTTSGAFTIVVGGSAGTTGTYTVQVTLNAALPSTTFVGPNHATTAQDLTGSFTSLGGGSDRGAVVGTKASSGNRDLYSVNLTAGSTATVGLTSLNGGSVGATLLSGLPMSIWSGASTTDANWMTPANWVGGVAPLPGNDLVFPVGAAQIVASNNNFPAGTDFHSITFNAAGYELFGNSVTLDAGITTNAPGSNVVLLSLILSQSQTFQSTYPQATLSLEGTITNNSGTLTFDGVGAIDDFSSISGSGAVVKNGPGTLELDGFSSYTGLTTINGGIVQTLTSTALGSSSAGTVVNGNATLEMNNSSLSEAEPLTLNGAGLNNNPLAAGGAFVALSSTDTWTGPITLTGDASIGVSTGASLAINGAVTLGGHTLTVNSVNTTTFNGAVGSSGDTGKLVVNGTLTTGSVILNAPTSYTGSTTIDAGTLSLASTITSSGTSVSAGFTVNQNAVLKLDNSVANNTNRLPDTATITLNGGTLSFQGFSGATSTETVGPLTLAGGDSNIFTTPGTSGSVALTIASLTRNATATVNFLGASLGTSSNKVTVTSAPTPVGNNGGILPYATFGTTSTTDFATYSSTSGIIAFPSSGYVTLGLAGNNDIVKLTTTGTTTLSADTPLLTGLLVSVSGVTTLALNGHQLHTGALMTAASANVTISGSGTLDLSGTSLTSGEGVVHNFNASGTTLTISSSLATTNSLVVSGTGNLFVNNTTESYTGGTTLNGGTTSASSFLTNSGALQVVTGALGTSSTGGALKLVAGTLQATTTSTVAVPVNLANSVATFGSSSATSAITVSGRLTLTGVNALTLTSASSTWTGQVTGSGSLEKLGTVTLTLTPSTASNYTGGTVLQAGTLNIGNGNTALGTGNLTLAGGFLQTSPSGGVTLANPVIFGGSTLTPTLSGSQNLTLSGTVTLTGPNTLSTTNTALSTFSGPITGQGSLTKSSSGTLALSGTFSQTYPITNNSFGGVLLINGSDTSSPVDALLGTVGGTGTIGTLVALANVGSASGIVNPGSGIGTLRAGSADLSNGGDLTIQVPGFGSPGVNYDQLNVSGALTLGGTSTLTLDLSGVSTTGTATSVVVFGSQNAQLPYFDQVVAINNPNNFGVQLTYHANSIDVTVVPGTPAPMVPITPDVWTGLGSTANWSNPANWASGVAPSAGDNLVFPAGAARPTATNDFTGTSSSFNSITISGTGFNLTGNSVTLQAGLTTTNLSGSNTFAISLSLGASETILSTFTTTLSVTGAITNNGNTLTVDGMGSTFITGAIGGGGGVFKNGTGTLFLENTNTYTGQTTVNAGILEFTFNQALGATTAPVVVNSGGELFFDNTNLAISNPLTLSGGGLNNNPSVAAGALVSNLASTSWNGPITLAGNASIGTGSGVTLTIAGNVTIGAGNTLTVNSGSSTGNTTFTGAVGSPGDGGSLVVNGNLTTGTVTLQVAAGYTGPTTVAAGTLVLNSSATAASTSYTVNQNATLRLDNTATSLNNRLPSTSSLFLYGGTFNLQNTAASGSSSQALGTVTLVGGHSTISTTGATTTLLIAAGTLTRSPTATVNFVGINLGASNDRITFTTALTPVGNGGGILPYAMVTTVNSVGTVTSTDFATYSSGAGIAAFASANYVTNLSLANDNDVVKLTAGQPVTANTKALAGLLLSSTAGVTLTLSAGVTLTTGSLLAANTSTSSFTDTITGGTLNLTGSSLTNNQGMVLTNVSNLSLVLSSPLALSDALVAAGLGTISMPNVTETYGGGTTLNSGTLSFQGSTNPLGTGALSLVGGSITNGSAVTVSNPVILNGANVSLGLNTLNFTGLVTLTGTNTVNTAGPTEISGKITGSGGLQKIGVNVLELAPTVPNDYSGGTVLEGGSTEFLTANSPLGSGPVTLDGSPLIALATTGLTLANPIVLNSSSTTIFESQNITLTGPVMLTANTGIEVFSYTTTFSGPISGPGAITKFTSGTLVLSGTNSETGGIYNDGAGGVIQLTGSPLTAPVGSLLGAVAGTAKLNTLVANAANGGASGIDNPGTGVPGTQQVGTADFSNGGDLTIGIPGFGTAGGNYDQLNVTGALTLGGTSVLTIDLTGLTTTGTASGVVLFGSRTGYLPTFSQPTFSQVAVINNPNNYGVQVVYNANSIDVVVTPGTAIPIPPATPTATPLAVSTAGPQNLSQVISNFTAPATGTYYIALTGPAGTSYSLVVTRNATFEAETNNAFSTGQNLDGTQGVLGAVTPHLVEGFDTGPSDLANYIFTGSNLASITGAAAHDGPFGLQLGSTTEWMYDNSAATQVQQGETISVWIKAAGTATGRAYFGFGAGAAGTLSIVLSNSDSTLQLQDNTGYNFTTLASVSQVWLPNHWYRFEVVWGISGDNGNITGRVYDSDGVTPLNTVSATDNNFPIGGIAFRGFGPTFDFDSVQVTSSTDADWYGVSANAGDPLTFTTSTPLDGAGVVNDPLSPGIQLFDPFGNPVTVGQTLADGRNQQLSATAAITGVYRLAVTSPTSTLGEYAVSVGGATGVASLPRVIATSVPAGAALLPGALSYQVTFSKPMNVSLLSASDFQLHGTFAQAGGVNYTPSGFSFDPSGTVLTLVYANLPVDQYTLTLFAATNGVANFADLSAQALDGEFSGSFPTGNGVAGGNFVTGFTMLPAPDYPTPLVPDQPQGSLIYAAPAVPTGLILAASNTETFTLALDPGETISIFAAPTGPTALQPTVSVFDPSGTPIGSAAAAAAGQTALLQTIATTTGGTYAITVGGMAGTTGYYRLGLTLNAALEAAAYLSGVSDSTLTTAQALDASFLSLPDTSSASRGAVVGSSPTGVSGTWQSYYSVHLNPGDSLTVGLKDLAGTGTTVAVVNSSGIALAGGVPGAPTFDSLVSDFPSVLNPGTYYILVTGPSAATYDLVVDRNAAFESGTNATSATAQPLDGTEGVLGLATATPVRTTNTVVPNAYSSISGDTGNAFPFNIGSGTPGGMRYQQLYSHTQFASAGTISAISFRRASGSSTFSLSNINVQIDIGYAATTVATASTMFANNRGSNMVTVYNGLLSLSSSGSGTPNPFDIVINFTSQFNYNPAQGDLLVDIFMKSAPTTVQFDFVSSPQGAMSRVFSTNGSSGSYTLPTGSFGANGLVTNFSFASNTVPNAYANTPGDTGNAFPFNIAQFSTASMRYQQIYNHAQFASGGYISAISFRPGAGDSPFSTSGINVRIDVGYAATTVATVSSTFASNRSTSMITVYNGLLSLTSTGSGTPNPFDVVINVSPLFNYNPAQGDLLVDIFMFNSPTTTFLDFVSSSQGTTSRVFSASGTGTVNSPIGIVGASNGLVTNFSFATPSWYSIHLNGAADELNLTTSVPAGGSGQFANNFVPFIALYDPFGNLVAAGTPAGDGRNQVLQYLATVPGTYTIMVIAQAQTAGEFFLSARTVGQSPTVPLSSLASTIIDDGTVQRSEVRSITLQFSGDIVSVGPSAFTLTRTEDGLVVPVIASALSYDPQTGTTTVTLTFSGPSLDYSSLSDGYYTLTINGSQIVDSNGNMVDAANNGTAGSVATVSFFRFFGDMNGDGLVDVNDLMIFETAYLSGDATMFNSALAFDQSTTFDMIDIMAFLTNFMKRQLT